jgi:NDP-sugar pyrophosphorylase family protein
MENEEMSYSLLVPAAGRGSRMESANIPKVLVPFKGKALIDWAMSRFLHQAEDIVLVIQEKHKENFVSHFNQKITKAPVYVIQETPLGTAQAVSLGLNEVKSEWTLLIWGDHVGASQLDLDSILTNDFLDDIQFILPLVQRNNPYVYFSHGNNGSDLNLHETIKGAIKIDSGLSDCGVFIFQTKAIKSFLASYIQQQSITSETDLNFLSTFPAMEKAGVHFRKLILDNVLLTFGVNSPKEMIELERYFNETPL